MDWWSGSTLMNMLRNFVVVNRKDWDQWLPYLLFAYQEVPQASTSFSPVLTWL